VAHQYGLRMNSHTVTHTARNTAAASFVGGTVGPGSTLLSGSQYASAAGGVATSAAVAIGRVIAATTTSTYHGVGRSSGSVSVTV